MDNRTTLMYGVLLHDIGKIITRSNEGTASHQTAGKQFLQQLPPFNDEQFLQLVAYHDLEQIKRSKLSTNSLSYLLPLANDIARGIDRKHSRDKEDLPLSENGANESLHSIFNIISSERSDETGFFHLQISEMFFIRHRKRVKIIDIFTSGLRKRWSKHLQSFLHYTLDISLLFSNGLNVIGCTFPIHYEKQVC